MNAFDLPNLDAKDYCHRYVMFRLTIAIRHLPSLASIPSECVFPLD